MAQQKVASLRSHLFAHKGTAKPATGFRVLESALEEDEAAEAPASSPYARSAWPAAAAEEDLRPAGSLQRGGFQFTDAEPIDVGEVEPEDEQSAACSEAVASNVSPDSAPQQLVLVPPPPSRPVEKTETETAEDPAESEGTAQQPAPAAEETPAAKPARFGSDLRQQILIPVGLAALLLVAAAIGYGLSTFLRGNTEESVVATPSETKSGQSASASEGDPTADPTIRAETTNASAEAPIETEGLNAAPTTGEAPVPELEVPGSEPVTGEPAPSDVGTLAETAPAGEGTEAPVPATKPSQLAAAPVADTYVVQIGSLPSRDSAERLWQQVTQAHGGIFAGLKLDVQNIELDGQSYFRARTGQFSGFEAANTFCQTLRGRDLDCLVVKP